MDDILGTLTPEQALSIVQRLAGKGGELREVVLAEARRLLAEFDVTEVAEDVLDALDSIQAEDLWDRSGASHDDYTPPDDAAVEMIDEELQPFRDQVERYHAIGMLEEEMAYCMGVILGVYRFDQDSQSEFKEASTDASADWADSLLGDWWERNRDAGSRAKMRAFLHENCPEWIRWPDKHTP